MRARTRTGAAFVVGAAVLASLAVAASGEAAEDAPVDDELIALMRSRRAMYVTTLFVHVGYELALTGRWKPTDLERRAAIPEVVDELMARRRAETAEGVRAVPHALANIRRLFDAGIVVAAGSDAGNIGTLHGPGFMRELMQLAEAGLTPHEVLQTATIGGARVLGREARIGRIARGRVADLVLLDANPLDDVANLQRATQVIRQGQVFSVDELARFVHAP